MRVALTGSTGLIGSALVPHLASLGHETVRVVRRTPAANEIEWSPSERRLDSQAFEGIDAVIHLAGAGIGDHRWTDEYKRVLVESRTRGTALVSEAIAAAENGPKVLLSGSAIGYYGARGDEELDENSAPGDGFLADLVVKWEEATGVATASGARVALLRTGIVLSADGGALKKQLPLFKIGAGGRIGSGTQWQSWISIVDEVAAITHLLTADISGPVNLTAPNPVTQAEFADTLGRVLSRPTVLPIPKFGPRLLLGAELAESLLFTGQKVLSRVLGNDAGFAFAHPDLEPALRAVLGRVTVAVVGAGLAGLSCAVRLHTAGIPVRVYEAADGVGGRVRTDHVDGFTLDRGFQVALTAYPELHRQFDLDALDLRAFDPGALVWRNGRGAVVADPFRRPTTALSTVTAPIGTLFDKARIARLRHRVRGVHPVRLLQSPDGPTAEALREAGFSAAIIERFFRPLVGGIQLDPELSDSRRMFDIIFRMLADGESAVPAAGMQAIPDQLAARLPAGAIELSARVTGATATSVSIAGGDEIAADAVVVATEGPAASALLDLAPVASKAVGCVYFAADESPTEQKLVVLDGTGRGPVLNVAVMSNVAPSYAPAGRHLIAAALPGHTGGAIAQDARSQLRGWWGPQVDAWSEVATYRIAHGQPAQPPPFVPKRAVRLPDGRFVCGDHRDTASIQGALYSGRRCADAVAATLSS